MKLIVVLVTCALAACGSADRKAAAAPQPPAPTVEPEPEPDPDLVGELLLKIGAQRDLVCTCEDQACVDHHEAELLEWLKVNMVRFKDAKPTPEQNAASDRLGEEIAACKERVSR